MGGDRGSGVEGVPRGVRAEESRSARGAPFRGEQECAVGERLQRPVPQHPGEPGLQVPRRTWPWCTRTGRPSSSTTATSCRCRTTCRESDGLSAAETERFRSQLPPGEHLRRKAVDPALQQEHLRALLQTWIASRPRASPSPGRGTSLRAAARKLTKADRSCYGLVLQPNVDAMGHWLYANQGRLRGAQTTRSSTTSSAWAALKYWVDMVNNDRSVLPSFDPQKGVCGWQGSHVTSTPPRRMASW